jgi:hypothetical protein
MIKELTPEQQAKMPEYRDKWIEYGLGTEPVNFDAATAALAEAYRAADFEPPATVLFASGPRHAVKLFREQFPDGTWDDFINNIIYGNHDADWASYVDFFQSVVGLDLSKGNGLIELAKTSGWVWVSKDLAIIMDRPSHIHMDENDVLHAEDRPSVLYRDGFAVYSWHGQRVPREWIMEREKLTAAVALGQENVEMRRAACEIVGWKSVLEQLNYRLIEQDEDPMIGMLVEVDLPDSESERFLMVKCGTGRDFAIPVPPDMQTALEANAWTFSLNPEELRDLEVRT